MDKSSDYLDRKMGILFNVIDRNKKGIISEDDFFMVPKKLDRAGKTQQAETLRTAYKLPWDTFMQRDTNASHVTRNEFIVDMRTVRKTDWFVSSFLCPMANAYFDSVDKNHDSTIDINEWRAYYSIRGMDDEKFIKRTFDKIDSNKDGKITRQEFQHAIIQFALGNDPHDDYSFLYDLGE